MWGKWYKAQVRVVVHLLFWVAVSLLYYLSYERLVGEYYWIFMMKDLFVTSTLFYLASWLLPKWVLKGKILLSLIGIVFSFLWWVGCTYVICKIGSDMIPPSESKIHAYFNIFLEDGFWGAFSYQNLSDVILDFLFLISLPLSPKLTKVIFEDAHKLTVLERDKASLERDHLQLELDTLKSQISPHFVFNTLNSIYRMAEKQDPNTADSILNLSNLLKYILYQTKGDLIYIAHEVQFLKDFLNLMKLRYPEDVRIEITTENTDEPYQIVPLILIPFIENAIKHGPDRSRKDAWVKVSIKIEDGVLKYRVSNSVNNRAEQHQNGGLGLQNIKRRLDIYYHGHYLLDVKQDDQHYSVLLEIKL